MADATVTEDLLTAVDAPATARRGRKPAVTSPAEAAPVDAAPVEAAPVEAAPVEAAPVEAVAELIEAVAAPVAEAIEAVVPAETAPVEAEPLVAKSAPVAKAPRAAKIAKVAKAPRAAKVPPVAKVAKVKPAPLAKVAKVAPAVKVKPAKAKPAAVKAFKAPLVAAPRIPAPVAAPAVPLPVVSKTARTVSIPTVSTIAQMKDTIMAKTTEIPAMIKTAFTDLTGKAKGAYEKGTAAVGDATEFAKGNVEAAVESGKILAAGLKDMGTEVVAEGKSAFETATADVKSLAAVKTPTEFFQLQTSLMKRNFEAAVAYSAKSTEAMTKLANDAFAPLSGRVTLAVEKVSKAA